MTVFNLNLFFCPSIFSTRGSGNSKLQFSASGRTKMLGRQEADTGVSQVSHNPHSSRVGTTKESGWQVGTENKCVLKQSTGQSKT